MRKGFFIVFPLLLGLLIYYLPIDYPFQVYVRNYIPDACWAFSFTYVFFTLWQSKLSLLIRIVPLLLFLGFEAMQKIGILTGTFDYYDCLTYVLAYLLASIIFGSNEKKRNS